MTKRIVYKITTYLLSHNLSLYANGKGVKSSDGKCLLSSALLSTSRETILSLISAMNLRAIIQRSSSSLAGIRQE